MIARRLTEMLAMMAIGDGVLALTHPQRHAELWRGGPPIYREVVDWCARHPGGTSALGALEIGFGYWLATRQLPSD